MLPSNSKPFLKGRPLSPARLQTEVTRLEETGAMQQEVASLEHAQSIATAHQETVSLARLLEEQQSAQERNQRVDQLYREQQERLKETVEKLTREVRSDVRKESREQLRTVADVFVREVRKGRAAKTQKVSRLRRAI